MKKILGLDVFKCRRMRGLIAASVYNDLSQKELKTLNSHLEQCAACRMESAGLKRLAQTIPVSPIELPMDLWPALRVARRETIKPSHPVLRLGWSTSLAFGLCAAVMCGVTYGAYRAYQKTAPVLVAEKAPAEDELAVVARMIENRDYVAAYKRLKDTIAREGSSALAGEAQLQLADLAYSKLNWYPEAYEAYDRLFREHRTLFSSRPECICRRELLDEARGLDYAPLYALDAARRAGEDTFARLESVVARYPGTLVASLAAEDMALQSAEASAPQDGASHVLAMEKAKGRCTNPLAIARLKLEIGHIYVRELKDTVKARSFYTEVATSEDRTLSTLAQGSLAALGE